MRTWLGAVAAVALLGGGCAHDRKSEEGTGGAGTQEQTQPPASQGRDLPQAEQTEEDEVFGRSYEDDSQQQGTGGAGQQEQDDARAPGEGAADDELGGTGGGGG